MRWLAILALIPISAFAFQGKAPAQKPTFEKSVAPFIKKYCVSCHAGPYAPDGVDYSKIKSVADANKERALLKKGVKYINNKKMPPKTALQPKPAEVKAFSDWVAKGKD
jgi:cytochrome c551/c552